MLTHMKREDRVLWKCDECDGNVEYMTKSSLLRHKRNVHSQ